MAFNFPNTPADGALFTPVTGGPTYTWNAAMGAWKITSGGLSAGVWIGDSPPVNPVQGQLWWNSTTGMTMIWFVDPTSSQWVQFNTGPVGNPLEVPKVTKFNANGTWTPDPKMLHGYMTAKGGGGGGGGANVQPVDICGCCGGAEGSTATKYFRLSDITLASYAVTVGGGGAGGNSTSTPGGTGGNSAVGSLVLASGGGGGVRFAPGSGQGGSIGDIIIWGAPGEMGSSSATSASIPAAAGGGGGAGGAPGNMNGTSPTAVLGGSAPANTGGGGGGASSYGAGPGQITGGSGGSGFVVIVEYCTL